MKKRFRSGLKNFFDKIVYRYAFVNWILRNINKKFSGFTSFRLRPYGIMKVRFKSGIEFKMLTNETSSVTKLLFWNGPENYEYTGIFESLLLRCRNFIDVGANTGYYSLLAATKNPGMHVFAFEPAAAPFHYLESNININHLKNAQAYPIALSNSAGEIEFFEMENPKNYHSQYNLAGTGTLKGENVSDQGYNCRKVPTISLDDWIQKQNLTNIDLIKIDTEGTEHLILQGADQLLREQEPIIICETLFHVIEEQLDSIMQRYNYHFFNYRNGQLHKASTLVRDTDNGFRDCFFVPSTKIKWVENFIQPESH